MTDAAELIDLLHRRGDLLATLLDEPTERYELVDRVPASKSTVYKGVSQLEGRGLIERTPRGLEPTLFGVVAHERYREGKGRARRISNALITATRAAIVTTPTTVLPVTNHAAETSVASTPRASANEERAVVRTHRRSRFPLECIVGIAEHGCPGAPPTSRDRRRRGGIDFYPMRVLRSPLCCSSARYRSQPVQSVIHWRSPIASSPSLHHLPLVSSPQPLTARRCSGHP